MSIILFGFDNIYETNSEKSGVFINRKFPNVWKQNITIVAIIAGSASRQAN